MGDIFLSASVPVVGRGTFHEDSDPFLIQFAVRELLTVCLGRRTVVWGGHPAITPMVWAVCEDLGISYAKTVVLYQSRHFKELFPEENRRFDNVMYTDDIDNNRDKSLLQMRESMLARDYDGAVFIGGMEGVLDEYEMFRSLNPSAKNIAVGSPGGAAKVLADKLGQDSQRIDFARLFYTELGIDMGEPRSKVHKGPNPGTP